MTDQQTNQGTSQDSVSARKHRHGRLVLVNGISSIMLCLASFILWLLAEGYEGGLIGTLAETVTLLALVLGVGAVMLGFIVLRRIDKGKVNYSEKNAVIGGMVAGILGSILTIVVVAMMSLFFSSSILPHREGLTNNLCNIAQDAFQYRMRPAPTGGGGYTGYQISSALASDRWGTYTISAADSVAITIVATSRANSANTVTARVDSTGKLGPWKYTGDFE